jgi:hypothetical protein
MASNRPRYVGDTSTDLDIWVAQRRNKNAPFGAPENLASPVNSLADDFCPTPIRHDETLYFGRSPGPEGSTDIYVTTRESHGGH